ncbi:MAG: ATP-binding SpoIIE family protein phosphatase [Myxococcaceae bacterium]
MSGYESIVLEVSEPSQVGEARRLTQALGRNVGLGEEEQGRISLIATELATNLAKHAKQGYLLVRSTSVRETHGVEILAVDKGPGISNIGQALRDGFSTSGTPGHGLGVVKRQSTEFDIASHPGKGTVVLSHVCFENCLPPGSLEVGAVCVRLKGEQVAGDGWALHERNGRATLLVVDGLGHGRFAADAAGEAIRTFADHAAGNPEDILKELHAELRKTRGAAGAVAEMFCAEGRVSFSGVGNVAGTVLVAGKRHNLVSQNGTLGAESRRITVFDYPFPEDAVLVLATDGVATHWDLSPYPGLLHRHPSIIAAVIHRDFSRGRDDATVVVAKRSSPA